MLLSTREFVRFRSNDCKRNVVVVKIVNQHFVIVGRFVAHIDKHKHVDKAFARAQIVFDKSAPFLFFLLVYLCISVTGQIDKIVFAVVYFKIIEQARTSRLLRSFCELVLIDHKIDKRGLADIRFACYGNFGNAVVGHLACIRNGHYELCLFYHLLHLLFFCCIQRNSSTQNYKNSALDALFSFVMLYNRSFFLQFVFSPR